MNWIRRAWRYIIVGSRILILGRSHLEHVLCVYRRHYNEHRPHRALDLFPPNGGGGVLDPSRRERDEEQHVESGRALGDPGFGSA
jgi:hypothetical protein